MKKYAVGIDFGTLSGRAVIMDAHSGQVLSSAVCQYRHGVMDKNLPSGKPLPKRTALQDAGDYVEVLSTVVRQALSEARVSPEDVIGVGIDFTACTMLPVDRELRPLMFDEKYKDEPHAYVKLWKHNSAAGENEDINRTAKARGESWLDRYSGKASAEWMFAKLLQTKRNAPEVYRDAYMFMEAADWLTYLLTGEVAISASFAGFKAFWDEDEGFPSKEFFRELDPELENVIGTKICDNISKPSRAVGYVNKAGSELLGLPVGTPVATPVIDAPASMPALGLCEDGTLMMILGTSAVYLVNSREGKNISGINGCVKNGVIEGLYTYEAAQATCGDHLDWFVKNCVPEAYAQGARAEGVSIHKYLRDKASKLRVGESGLLCLDWQNGNRSPLKDLDLTGALFGLTLQTSPEEIYRAFIEGTVFGAKIIIDNFESGGVKINKIVASGGIAEKDEMFMQIMADVLDRDITVSEVKTSAAVGSAIYATVAAGIYENITEAAKRLGSCEGKTYHPIAENSVAYGKLYAEYLKLYEFYGRGGSDLLKKLKQISAE